MACLTIILRASLALVGGVAALAAQTTPTTAAIDAEVWKPIVASVANDDIAAMGRIYHPDAVLVDRTGTRRIRDALAGWGRDMVANKAKGIRASVALRFGKRQDDAETAFESGIFRYAVTDPSGKATPRYQRMEALLVKQDGKWRILMEHQLEVTTETAWSALPQ